MYWSIKIDLNKKKDFERLVLFRNGVTLFRNGAYIVIHYRKFPNLVPKSNWFLTLII